MLNIYEGDIQTYQFQIVDVLFVFDLMESHGSKSFDVDLT